MNNVCKQLCLAVALAAITIGCAYAGDGGNGSDSGDNGMSQWTGESYRAFHDNRVGDFPGPREEVARPGYPAAEPSTQVATTFDRKHGTRVDPFRDDTAA